MDEHGGKSGSSSSSSTSSEKKQQQQLSPINHPPSLSPPVDHTPVPRTPSFPFHYFQVSLFLLLFSLFFSF
jgi:hypothetical protein